MFNSSKKKLLRALDERERALDLATRLLDRMTRALGQVRIERDGKVYWYVFLDGEGYLLFRSTHRGQPKYSMQPFSMEAWNLFRSERTEQITNNKGENNGN